MVIKDRKQTYKTYNKINRQKNPENYEKVERSRKHRYILVVGNKREKKDIYNKIKYPLDLPYPKGESKYYKNDTDIETQLLLM